MIASKSVLFVYVSTNCGSCDETLKLIKKLAQEQMVTEFVIVSSSDDLLASKEKYSYNQLKSTSNIKLLYDKNSLFIDAFDLGFVIEYPTLFYYSSSKETLIQIKSLSKDMIFLNQ